MTKLIHLTSNDDGQRGQPTTSTGDTSAARAARALTRDESKLRQALDIYHHIRNEHAHGGNDFDALHTERDLHVATIQLRRQLQNLHATVTTLQRNDRFWQSLKDAHHATITAAQWEQFETVQSLTSTDLAELLEATGYTYPPPPPVDDLVNPLIGAIEQLANIRTVDNADALINLVRREMILTTYRIDRQLRRTPTDDPATNTLVRPAQQLGATVRTMLPAVIINAAGVVTNIGVTAAAGPAIGPFAGPIAAGIVTEAGKKLSERLLDADQDDTDQPWSDSPELTDPDTSTLDEWDRIHDEYVAVVKSWQPSTDNNRSDPVDAHQVAHRYIELHHDQNIPVPETLTDVRDIFTFQAEAARLTRDTDTRREGSN